MVKGDQLDYLKSNLSSHLDNIKQFIAIPSISAENREMQECARFLRDWVARLGANVAEVSPTGGHSVVYAEFDHRAPLTLIVYFMYDVKQVSGEKWTLTEDPFKAREVGQPPFKKVLVGRGATNQKGPCGAFLNSVEAIIKTEGRLPVNLKLVCDGEEEIGSPNLRNWVLQHQEMLTESSGAVFPSCALTLNGQAQISLGCKGSAPFELECSGRLWGRGPTKYDIHSSYAALVDSPAWRMICALATMVDPAKPHEIRIDGFYDNVDPPTASDLELVERFGDMFDEESAKQVLQVQTFMQDLKGKEAWKRLLFSPTLNIQGIYGGYIGPGFKTSMPHMVRVKMEARLVPRMTYKEVLEKVRKHLDKHGHQDVQIVAVRDGGRSHEWSRTDSKSPLVQAVVETYKAYGKEPMIWPLTPGSAPFYVFTKEPLKLPLVTVGLNHGGRAHSPDEYIVIEGNERVHGLVEQEASFVTCLYQARAHLT